MVSIILWFTSNFIIKLALGLFLRYSYNLGFHSVLIKGKACISFIDLEHLAGCLHGELDFNVDEIIVIKKTDKIRHISRREEHFKFLLN